MLIQFSSKRIFFQNGDPNTFIKGTTVLFVIHSDFKRNEKSPSRLRIRKIF